MKQYLKRSNNIPMSVLGWKSPLQKRAELECIVDWSCRQCDDFTSLRSVSSSHCPFLNTFLFLISWCHIIDKWTKLIIYLRTIGNRPYGSFNIYEVVSFVLHSVGTSIARPILLMMNWISPPQAVPLSLTREALLVKTAFRLEHQASFVKGRWHGFAVTEGFKTSLRSQKR